MAVGEGFVEVTGNQVAILTDNAANSVDIDEAAAEEARRKAENRLKEGDISEEEAKIRKEYEAIEDRLRKHKGVISAARQEEREWRLGSSMA